jgi:Flp pilus assembly protein TadG
MQKHRRLTLFVHHQQGIVLVEMILVIPILVSVFALTLHLASVFYITSGMEKSARLAARQLAQGHYDDETSGTLTPCSNITNTSTATGMPSAEYLACESINSTFGTFDVTAYDGNSAGPGVAGTAVYVELQIHRDELLNLVPSALEIGPEKFTARTTMHAEPPPL